MFPGAQRTTRPVRGRNCRSAATMPWRALWLAFVVVLVAGGSIAQAQDDASTKLSPHDWQQRLRQHTDDFATARLLHRQGKDAIERGDLDEARRLFDSSASLDPRFDRPRRQRAALDLRDGDFSGFNSLYEAARDRIAGYRNLTISLSNLLLTLDAVVGAMLVWCALAFLIRYLPYLHHRVAQWLVDDGHRRRRARLLWPVVIAPFVVVGAWGFVPFLALSIPLVWIHGDRRPRILLGILLSLLAVQGVWPRPFAAVMAGTDPSSLPSLVERAAYEPPTEALREQLHARLEKHPHDADLLLAEGLLLARRGDFAASQEVLLDHLERRPDDVPATNNLAASHFFLGDVDRAVAGFQRASALDSLAAVPYYNLSQAYLHKLFLKEGGLALQSAMRHGFAVTEQVERLPRGAVYFLRPSMRDYWRLAWNSEVEIGPFHALSGHETWLGVPSGHVGGWLSAILVVSFALGFVLPRKRLVFECVNCGSLTCRHCRGEHEGAVLCTSCAMTARRAKSEMVLTTLLRNRRRDAEAVYQQRMTVLDAWLPGAGALADGVRRRGVWSAILISLSTVALIFGGPPLSDPWDLDQGSLINVVRLAGLALLVVTVLLNTAARSSIRGRHLQPHPNSAVSLAGLIEGRAPQRARAGG